jgi:sequestosome 1
MSLTVKAFLYRRSWKEEPVEIRRFSLDEDVSSSYSYLVQKLGQVFPSVPAEDIELSWADAEGDHISISSDDELLEALDQFDGSIFKVHLRRREKPRSCYGPQPVFCPLPCHPPPQPPTHGKHGGGDGMEEETPPAEQAATNSTSQPPQEPKEGPHHVGVVCDGCSSGIYGVRYKCLVCPDYDLCATCEKKGEHVNHNMVSIRDPLSFSPWGRFRRGGCGGPWMGRGGRHCGRGHGAWASPYFLQHLFGGQWGHGPHRFSPGQGQPEKQEEGKSEEMDTEQQEAEEGGAQSREQAHLEREQRESYLQDIGEAVSNFLRPFGVKVDVGVVGEAESEKKEESGDSGTTPSAPGKVPSGYDGDTVSRLTECIVHH